MAWKKFLPQQPGRPEGCRTDVSTHPGLPSAVWTFQMAAVNQSFWFHLYHMSLPNPKMIYKSILNCSGRKSKKNQTNQHQKRNSKQKTIVKPIGEKQFLSNFSETVNNISYFHKVSKKPFDASPKSTSVSFFFFFF